MHWDEQKQETNTCTMWEYIVNEALDRSAWLVGPAGLGKSTQQLVWARFWCRSCLKLTYLYGCDIYFPHDAGQNVNIPNAASACPGGAPKTFK